MSSTVRAAGDATGHDLWKRRGLPPPPVMNGLQPGAMADKILADLGIPTDVSFRDLS